jgi:DNA-binding protein
LAVNLKNNSLKAFSRKKYILRLIFKKGVKKMSELPIAALDRLIRKAGAERVSEDAAEELGKILSEVAIDISKQAIELARHAKRKTVTAEDIKLATKTMQ